jgi:hypothetical protein
MHTPLTLDAAVQAADKSLYDSITLEGIPHGVIPQDPGAPPKIKITWMYQAVPITMKFHFLAANVRSLLWYGLYEKLFIDALTGARTNHHHVDLEAQRFLLSHCRRPELRRAGDSFENGQPGFLIYRGVAGDEADARPAGLSWTRRLDVAAFFAIHNAQSYNLPHPRVYMAYALPIETLAYTNRREEDEVIIGQARGMTDMSLTHENLMYRADVQRRVWQRGFGRSCA